MNTNGKKLNMITIGLMALVFLFTASMANAATIAIHPHLQEVNPGDPVSLSVTGIEFPTIGVNGGSISMNWDETILMLDTTIADIIGDGGNTGFTDLLGFSLAPGQLDISLASNIFLPPPGLGSGAFTFLNLDFTALAAPGTDVGILLGPGGNWQLADFSELAAGDVIYEGAIVTVVNAVPVPGAAWLLGSGLLGLVGIARRRAA